MDDLNRKLNIKPKITPSFFFYMISIFVLACTDLWSKYFLIWHFEFDKVILPFINGYFDFMLTEHMDETLQINANDLDNYVLTMFVIASIVLILSFMLTLNFDRYAKFFMMLVIAGGIGNFIDKYFSFNATNIMCSIQQSSGYHSICFNIADFFIIFGVMFALIYNVYFFLKITVKNTIYRFFALTPVLILMPYFMFGWLINSF